jgi:hypothetical protein
MSRQFEQFHRTLFGQSFRHRHFAVVLAAKCTSRRIAKIFPNPLGGRPIFRADALTSTG